MVSLCLSGRLLIFYENVAELRDFMKGRKIFLITALVVISLPTGYCQVSSWADKENWYESVREFDEEYPDVFYLVSTNILHEEGSWIARNTPEEKAILAREIRHIEMNLFRDSLNIFAPYYHQHTMDAASLEKSEYDAIAAKIVDEAYEAFRYYLKHLNGGRPIVLVGFSQGAMLTKELLKKMTPSEYERIVAAYVLGWGLSSEDIQNPQVRPARVADDTGVCISFNSVSDTSAAWALVLNNAVCSINPVNWKTDSTPASFEYKGQKLSVSLSTASMTLVVSGFEESKHPFQSIWPSGCLHSYEIKFYNDFLWHNAIQRVHHYLAQ